MEIQISVTPSELWLRDELEKVYALLFRYVGNDTRLALCSVGWLTTREFVSVRSHARYTDALNAIFLFVPTCVQVSWC